MFFKSISIKVIDKRKTVSYSIKLFVFGKIKK